MIENRATAQEILKTTLELTSHLDGSIHLVMENGSEKEISQYKNAVGHVMAEAFEWILVPIVRRHPELKPQGWSSWFK